MPVIRNKTVLTIIDGVHGLYAWGPYGLRHMSGKQDHVLRDGPGGGGSHRMACHRRQARCHGSPPGGTIPAGFPRWDAGAPAATYHGCRPDGLGEYRDDNIKFRTITLA